MFKRLFNALVLVALSLALSACVSIHAYVDNSLGDTNYADLKKSAAPQPIQLLFEFQTKGVSNARATESTRPKVFEEISRSGMFSSVSYEPVASGRKLSVLIQNVPLTDNPGGKGFVTGLTLGLAGSTVADGYICTITYIEPGHDNVATEVKHSIVTTVGNATGPAGLAPMTLMQAFDKVVRQMIGKGLRDLGNVSDLAQ
ncbi:hypothetical protein [Herbaspirillum sp. NPDC087042]|uniref:hypothetical protein n=1 Tax=Herbaspirillum sp. NPDC087042 TaxID=3364004 RepID=UPI00380DAFE3